MSRHFSIKFTVAGALLSFLALLLVIPTYPVRGEEPVWVIMERSKRHLREGDYGSALRGFRSVTSVEPDNAEALRHIAHLFDEAGDRRQALRYYERALEANTFDIAATRAQVRYRRALIFEERRDWGNYEREMGEIFSQDEWFTSDEVAPVRENQLRLVRQQSLARTLVLYRLEASVFALPHTDYGSYLVRAGRFNEATPHLLRSSLETLSHAIERYRQRNRDYEFGNLFEFTELAAADREIQRFLRERDLWRTLYYLAHALYFDGYSTRGRELWHLVESRPEAGEWIEPARAQLQDPSPPRFP